MKRIFRQSGFTLIELMVGLVVAIIILGISVPSFQSMIQSNRSAAVANDFITTLQLARSEAIKRNTSISVCAVTTKGGTTCSADLVDWSNGWMVFVDSDGDGIHDSGEEVLYRQDAPPGNASFTSSVSQVITYEGSGFLGNSANGNYDLQLTGCKGDFGARRVTISTTGHPSVTRIACT